MVDLTTKFVGLTLTTPIIVASAGITETVERMKKCQNYGAGAIVMKSYFEEAISRKSPTPRFKIIRHNLLKEKTFTLFSYEQASEWDINRYAEEVSKAKSCLNIKIIPSINCITDKGWSESAKILESAGADAIELNTSCPHGSITFRGKAVEETIFNSVRIVREAVSIPIIAKISPMLTSPIGVVKELEKIGVDGVTIFNRMTALEIDIEEEVPIMHGGYAGHGGPWAIQYPLRWISEIRPKTSVDISGSGGVSNWQDVVKYILAGANTVQVCTAIIMNGYEIISDLLEGLKKYMDKKNYHSVDDFRGNVCSRILGTYDIDRRRKAIAHINYDDNVAPCVSACPAHVPAQAYVTLIAQGKFAEAVEVIRSKNPFQSVCGYICYHRCERECTRALIDQPIAIKMLKRFALEWADKNGLEIMGNNLTCKPSSGYKVAIIGSGPAGLTAGHDLRKMGYEVTLFEAMSSPGGTIRKSIPQKKLPHTILDREIEYIKELGVKIITNSIFGKDFTLSELKSDGFNSIVVAIGAKHDLPIPEELLRDLELSSSKRIRSISMDGVFYAGDVIHSSGRSVIQAVADGKISAIYTDKYIKGEPIVPIREPIAVDRRSVLIRSVEEPIKKRVNVTKIDGIEQTLTEEQAIDEARRCLACGCGIGCGKCYKVCIYSGVDLDGIRYYINDKNCDGCGLCVEICPNSAIKMVPLEF
ncbi:MAG: FAD-dependent oxidoreductase [bacterium]